MTTAKQDAKMRYLMIRQLEQSEVIDNIVDNFAGDTNWIIDWVVDNFDPEDVFSVDALEEWAKDNDWTKPD